MGEKQLVFVYVEDYAGFHKQGFNFSTKEHFSIAREGDEIIIEREDCTKILPGDFWGKNISDIALLIGGNGSGKTTLIQVICKWVCQLSEGDLPHEEGIFILREDNILRYIGFKEKKRQRISSDKSLKELSCHELVGFFRDLHLVYFSNTLTEFHLDAYEKFIDYSMPNRIKKANAHGFMSEDIITNYKRYEFSRQVDAMLNSKIEYFPIEYLKMEIHSCGFEEIIALLPNERNTVLELSDAWNYYFKQYITPTSSDEIILALNLLLSVFIGSIIKLIKWEQRNVSVHEDYSVIKIIEEIMFHEETIVNTQDITTGFEWVRNVLKDLFLDYRSQCKEDFLQRVSYEYWGENFEKDIDVFIAELQLSIKQSSTSFLGLWNPFFSDKKNCIRQMKLNKVNKAVFRKFWDAYKNIAFCMENVSFYWDASSGQQNWVSLFTALINVPQNSRNLWIFIDEPDNTFHPEWKRSLVENLVNTFEKDYEGRTVQAWISTHSPILLSDFPGPSVLYLDKKECVGKSGDTFAQNIYVLFNDAFFLHNGVIGKFASKKILDVFTELEDIERLLRNKKQRGISGRINQCDQIINLVGEPLFKRKMRDYLLKCTRLMARRDYD